MGGRSANARKRIIREGSMATKEVKEIIERAIKFEEDSYNLYTTASRRVKDPGAKAGLAELAGEEKKHKTKLEAMLAGTLDWAISVGRKGKVPDLKIGGPLEARPITDKSSLQDVLAVAIKREEATGAFYSQMAALVEPGQARDLFEMLAKEETRHKLYVEKIYEQDVYKDF
jgi:rubrerythrin